jgi:ABC-type transport system substrate-binding protein
LPSDPIYERLALELKRELAAVDVDMDVRSLTPDELTSAQRSGDYDAVLTETITGPTLLRLFMIWHSSGVLNPFRRGNPAIDHALEEARDATDDGQYRRAVADIEQAFYDDPPGILLAWSERARAISNRFDVPKPEPGRDVLATMRLWKPSNDQRLASRN